jgi:hypothetical protein
VSRRPWIWLTDSAPAVVSALSPSLGDISAGTPLKLSSTGPVLSVTIDGVACTGLVQIGTLVRCLAPALPAGLYDVQCSGPGGLSNVLVNAFEAWHPSVLSGILLDSTVGVTGDPVTAWADQGGGGNPPFIGVGATAPDLVANLFGNDNRPGLNFTFAASTQLALAAQVEVGATFSRFWVAKRTRDLFQSTFFAGPGNGGVNTSIMPTGEIGVYDANGGVQHEYGAGYDDGSAGVFGVVKAGVSGDPGACTGYYNGDVAGAPDSWISYGTGQSWKYVGGGDGNFADVSTACVFQALTAISAPNVAKLSQWMFGKFVARSYATRRVSATTTWTARDGAALVALGTDLYMLGGWTSEPGFLFNGDTSRVTNEVWKSTDSGVSWTKILDGDYTYSATVNGKNATNVRWTPRHMLGAFAFGGLIYVVGSDPFNNDTFPGGSYISNLTGTGTADVWSSPNGVDWTCVTATAAWGPRVNQMVGVLGSTMYVMGGQRDCTDDSTALSDVWSSSDGGATWTQLADAPWTARGLVGNVLPTLNGKMYVAGGGVYGLGGTPPPGAEIYNNDVWSFDGSSWLEVSAPGAAAFSPRRYHSLLAMDSRLWLINGFTDAASNSKEVWHSPDGVTWTEHTISPWRPSHADGAIVMDSAIYLGPGNGDLGQPSGAGVGHVSKIVQYEVTP